MNTAASFKKISLFTPYLTLKFEQHLLQISNPDMLPILVGWGHIYIDRENRKAKKEKNHSQHVIMHVWVSPKILIVEGFFGGLRCLLLSYYICCTDPRNAKYKQNILFIQIPESLYIYTQISKIGQIRGRFPSLYLTNKNGGPFDTLVRKYFVAQYVVNNVTNVQHLVIVGVSNF